MGRRQALSEHPPAFIRSNGRSFRRPPPRRGTAVKPLRGVRKVITTEHATYPGQDKNLVRNSWGREAPFVKLEPGAKALSLQGWITREAGEKFLALAGRNLDDLLKASERADFRPIELGDRKSVV